MAKVNIQPVTLWVAGQQKTAGVMNIRSIGDDLETSAQFYYELAEADVITQDEQGNDVVTAGAVLANGNLGMSGQDYIDWGDQSGSNINQWACTWALAKLNLSSSVA